jgi:TRAP-type uncharacterized transport system substrate-binding protein
MARSKRRQFRAHQSSKRFRGETPQNFQNVANYYDEIIERLQRDERETNGAPEKALE